MNKLDKLTHEPITAQSTYAPWRDCPAFLDVHAKIQNHTLIDMYRLWELWSLVAQCGKLDPGIILEVGVWRGGSGGMIASSVRHHNIASCVYLCDTFTGVVKAGPNDSTYRGGEHADTSLQSVDILVFNNLGLKNVDILRGVFPEETARNLPGEPFRLVHVDVDTYQSARDTFDYVIDRMVPRGIIIFDDYGFSTCDGVTRLVNELTLSCVKT